MVKGRIGTCHHHKIGSGHRNCWLLPRGCTGEKVSPISLFCVLVEFLWDFYTILSALNDTNRFILSNVIALSYSRTVIYWVESLVLALTIQNDWLLWGVFMTPELTYKGIIEPTSHYWPVKEHCNLESIYINRNNSVDHVILHCLCREWWVIENFDLRSVRMQNGGGFHLVI